MKIAQDDEGREAVQELMEQAEVMVHHSMRENGAITPTLLIHGVNGNGMYCPEEMAGADSKDRFVDKARLICVAEGADATVFISEAWLRTVKEDAKPLDLSIPPSQAPDRVEIVVVMGETREAHFQKLLPILRTGEGKFMGFGEIRELGEAEKVEGRFANFVPPRAPDEKTRMLAKEALYAIGFTTVEKKKQQGRGRAIY
jgi:hypothetical protein